MERFSSNYSDYRLGAAIGFGAASIVYAAIHTPASPNPSSGKNDSGSHLCAIKLSTRHPDADQWLKEVRLLSSCRHTNILPIFAAFTVPPDHCQVGIVTPFIAGGSLSSIMAWRSGLERPEDRSRRGMRRGFSSIDSGRREERGVGRLEEEEVQAVMKQVVSGLGYLHNQGIVHRDIKAGNILVDTDGTILLADLGVGIQTSDHPSRVGDNHLAGSPCWMAPETILNHRVDLRSDIWSLGVTIIELMTGSTPLSHLLPSQILTHIVTSPPPVLTSELGASKALIDLLGLSCLIKDPSVRADVSRLEKHQWLKNARKSTWLADSLLKGLPPLIHRQELRRIPSHRSLASRTSSWDFNPTPSGSTLNTPVRPSSHLPRSPSAASIGSHLVPPGKRSGGTSPAASISWSSWVRMEGQRDASEGPSRTRRISGLERQVGSEPGRRRTTSLSGLPRRSPQSRGSVLETITPADQTHTSDSQLASGDVGINSIDKVSPPAVTSDLCSGNEEAGSFEADYTSVPMAVSTTSHSSDSGPRPLTPPSADHELGNSPSEHMGGSSLNVARGSLFSRRKSMKVEKEESTVKRVLRGLRMR